MRRNHFFPSTLLALFIGLGCFACDRDEPAVSDLATIDVSDDDPVIQPDADEDADDADDDLTDVGLDAEDDIPTVRCVPAPPLEAQLTAGENVDGPVLSPGGRDLTPVGTNVAIEGFPTNVVLHPISPWAYVASTSRDDRRLVVVDIESASIIQDIDRGEASYGLAITAAGDRLYASGGAHGRVDVYDVLTDGTLSQTGSIDTGGYPSGLALSQDESVLWIGLFDRADVLEADTETLDVGRRFDVEDPVWDVLHLSNRGELYTSTLEGEEISVLDIESGLMRTTIDVGQSPVGMTKSPDESIVWVAVAAIDRVVAIDPSTNAVVDQSDVTDAALADAEGQPLPHSNVNDVAYVATANRLYATRGADNAVSVFEADSMELLGSLPTAWYPTGVAVTPSGSRLIIVEGRGFGSGPNLGSSSKDLLTGSITIVELADLDLEATSDAAFEHYNRPTLSFPFECDGDFPVPTRPDQVSPITHVILVVKENKTFDCVFGDLTDMDVDADPELVRYGEEITPNQHALARQFAFSDNFYTEVENSDMGHVLLTTTHMTEYFERIWTEVSRLGVLDGYQVADQVTPEVGNLFTHLIDHDVDIRIYGQIVGMFARSQDGVQPFNFTDWSYPGGPAWNVDVLDESRGRYLAERIAEGDLATFSFVLLPNDHTKGTRPGEPTPESMVADNDYGLGILVEALSRSDLWESSVIIVVEDDPQACEDHVDSHRSFATIISPWARRGYVSHVNYSFTSVFATIERILGVPPLGRPDASASPMWDMFADQPDFEPYTAIERRVPHEVNSAATPGAAESMAMDFRSPDRNPHLLVVLEAYRLWRMGRISRAEADRRIGTSLPPDRLEELAEEAEEEAIAFESSWRQYGIWLRENNRPIPALRHGPVIEPRGAGELELPSEVPVNGQ